MFVSVFSDLIERKRVSAERQALAERERREQMELEEAFRENTKSIPGEVSRWSYTVSSHLPPSFSSFLPFPSCTCVHVQVMYMHACTCI